MVLSEFLAVCAANPWLSKYVQPELQALASKSGHVDPPQTDHAQTDFPQLPGPLFSGDEAPGTSAMTQALLAELQEIEQPPRAAVTLWQFYARQILRVAYAEFVRDLPPDQVGRQLSAAADALIDAALQYTIGRLAARRGLPERPDGSTPEVTVIGLGNFGGRELGYTSPLKLVFLYDSLDPKNVWHRNFYKTLVDDLTHMLRGDPSRPDGIDIDLREGPRFEVGVSICGFREALRVYETSGRIWQRLNFVKARVVAGSQPLGDHFLNRLQPWIYRQYMSRADLAELRTLRNKIEKRTVKVGDAAAAGGGQLAGLDVTRTPGGRDDVELTLQFLQLLHGASLPSVRCGNTYDAIGALHSNGCLTDQESALLLENYARLSRLQHQLSFMFDRRGRQLPRAAEDRQLLSWQLGIRTVAGTHGDLEKFESLLTSMFAANRQVIDRLMSDADTDEAGAEVAIETELLLDPDPDPAAVTAAMQRAGLSDPARAMDNLRGLATESVPFLSPHRCRHFLSSIAPALLAEIALTPNPDQALSSLETVADSLGAKATLWELLASSPPTMKLMVRLCATAPYLVEILTNNPGMIDELIDSLLMNRLPSAQRLDALSIELCRNATDIDRVLSSFKSSAQLTIGVRDILRKETLEATHQAIGDTAEACVRRVIEYDHELLAEKYGDPTADDGQPAEFVALALGKFGGREPNYHSDLEALFLYSAAGETKRRIGGHLKTLTNHAFFHELTQQVSERINGTPSGRQLYELNVRLGPIAVESEPVSSIADFFARYERDELPVAQRLALCKARPIFGSRRIRQQVQELIKQAILRTHWQPSLATQIRKIRQQLQQTADDQNLKRGSGGTLDVELVAQMLTLRHAKQSPQAIAGGTTASLAALAAAGHLDEKHSLGLINGYRTLRRIESNLRLMNTPARHDLPISDAAEMKNLAYLMGESDPDMIVAQCQQTRHQNRVIFDQVFAAAEAK
jgi:glutamate-ammonia-ligase adenylyltransferase